MSTPQFEDWLAICNVKARYCRFLDTKDWESWGQLFTDDFVLDTSPSGGTRTQGREEAVRIVKASIGDTVTAHHVHSPEIEIDGDSARAIWAMQDRNVWPDGRKLLGFGHYHERYRRENGQWRVAEQKLTRLAMEMEGWPEDPSGR